MRPPKQSHGWRRTFILGMGLGAILISLLAAVVVFLVVRQGVTVYIPTRVVAEAAGQEVERDAYQHLPELLSGLQRSLPDRLAEAVFPHLGTTSTKIKVGGLWIDLPPKVGQQLRGRVTQAFAAAVESYISRANRTTMARLMGQTADHLVRYEIATRLQGTRVILQPRRWLRIPVRLEFS